MDPPAYSDLSQRLFLSFVSDGTNSDTLSIVGPRWRGASRSNPSVVDFVLGGVVYQVLLCPGQSSQRVLTPRKNVRKITKRLHPRTVTRVTPRVWRRPRVVVLRRGCNCRSSSGRGSGSFSESEVRVDQKRRLRGRGVSCEKIRRNLKKRRRRTGTVVLLTFLTV